jgi:hypothetical protein
MPLLVGRIELRALEICRTVGCRKRTQHCPKGCRAKPSSIVRLRVIA